MIQSSFNKIGRFSLVVALSLAAWHADAATEKVGEVTLLIGQSLQIAQDGSRQPIQRGSTIRIGDRIETAEGGHVHIRFVDGGLVSVRPGSRLLIEDYQFNAAQPQAGAIRFKLEEGVVRSVTGRWGEAARERFRLNTPIAAIGVRGTDFTVKADREQLLASVQRGAIVVAPLSDACRADSLGPCSGASAQMLAADNGLMLELRRQQTSPRLVPLKEFASVLDAAPSSHGTNTQDERETGRDSVREPDRASESRAARSSTPQPTPEPREDQLKWGRWSTAWKGDTLSEAYTDLNKNWNITIGNMQYVLFRRTEQTFDFNSPYAPQGKIGFALQSGQAHLLRPSGKVELAQVNNGWFSVDFNRREFVTGLQMSHTDVGTVLLQSSGDIRANDYFSAQQSDSRVAGALSSDGREVGYLFDRNVPQGILSGITLWKR